VKKNKKGNVTRDDAGPTWGPILGTTKTHYPPQKSCGVLSLSAPGESGSSGDEESQSSSGVSHCAVWALALLGLIAQGVGKALCVLKEIAHEKRRGGPGGRSGFLDRPSNGLLGQVELLSNGKVSTSKRRGVNRRSRGAGD